MKILYVTLGYKPSFLHLPKRGGDISNHLLLKELSFRNHDVNVISMISQVGINQYLDFYKVNEPNKFYKKNKINIIKGMLDFEKNLNRYIKINSPDVILSVTSSINLASKVAKSHKIPVGAFVRAFENFPDKKNNSYKINKFLSFLFKKMTIGIEGTGELNNLDFIITNSVFMKKKVESYFPGPSSHIVYPPIDLSLKDFYFPKKIFKVAMVGNSYEKGIDIFEKISMDFQEIEFHVIGDRNLKDGNVVKKNNIFKHGWIEDIYSFFSDIDVVFVPSRFEEPFGRISVEALASGKFVLVSDRGGLPETVSFQKKLIVKYDDVIEWKNRFGELLVNQESFFDPVITARKEISNFSLNRQVLIFENILNSFVDN